MNHPTQEQWMEHLYDENSPTQKKELESHLKSCAPCREKRTEFEITARSLDRWQVDAPAKHELAGRWQPGLKWAAAAALLVTTAFATGRMTRPEIDVAALQAQISQPLEEKMQAQFALKLQEAAVKASTDAQATAKEHFEQLAVALATLRDEDKKAFTAALQAYDQQRLTDLRNMREDIERVALFSDQSYRSAQRQFVQLASFSQAVPDLQGEEN